MQLRDAAGVWLFRWPGGFLPSSEAVWQEPRPGPCWRCQLRWGPEDWNSPKVQAALGRVNPFREPEQGLQPELREAASTRASGRPE